MSIARNMIKTAKRMKVSNGIFEKMVEAIGHEIETEFNSLEYRVYILSDGSCIEIIRDNDPPSPDGPYRYFKCWDWKEKPDIYYKKESWQGEWLIE